MYGRLEVWHNWGELTASAIGAVDHEMTWHNFEWGTATPRDFEAVDARVVCREMGYWGGIR